MVQHCLNKQGAVDNTFLEMAQVLEDRQGLAIFLDIDVKNVLSDSSL